MSLCESVMFTDDSVKDVLNRTPYKKLSKAKERKLLRALKLSFYHKASDNPEKQAEYIAYFAEEYPWFKQKMSSDIDAEEKRQILEEAIAISTEVRDAFVLNNIRLAAKYSKTLNNYLNNTEDFADLFQEGVAGLMIAAEKFSFDKDYRFSTYATHCIKNNVQRYIEGSGRNIQVPASSAAQIKKISQVEETFLMKEHRYPTATELCDLLGITENRLVELQSLSKPFDYLDTPINEEGNTTGECIPSEYEDLEQAETQMLIDSFDYSDLTEEENEVLRLRFGFVDDKVYSRKEISDICDLKPSQVRTDELNAIKKMAKTIHPQTYYEISLSLCKAS